MNADERRAMQWSQEHFTRSSMIQPNVRPTNQQRVTRNNPISHLRISVFICGLSLLLAGCARPVVTEPLTGKLGGNDLDQQLEFWHQLADQPVCSNDEAFHGLLLFLDGESKADTYDARRTELQSRGLLSQKFSEPPRTAVSRGTMAVAIAKSLKIGGGAMYSLMPGCDRYAVRELVYLNVYPASSPNQTFSGSEFLGIIGRMEDWQRGNPADKPASQLPGEEAPSGS